MKESEKENKEEKGGGGRRRRDEKARRGRRGSDKRPSELVFIRPGSLPQTSSPSFIYIISKPGLGLVYALGS